MAVSRQEIELLRHVYDDWAHGDFHSGRDLLDEDMEFRMGGPYTEHAGDKVLVECHQDGHGKQSGAEVDTTLFTVWTFRNQRVVGLEFFSDETKARNAAGLV